MNAPRAGRAAKDRPNTKLSNLISQNKTSQISIALSTNDSDKSSENFNPKIQPTAEQMRIAQIINDGNRNDDPDIQNKIEQVMELTKKSRDEVQIALHDCDNDPERAALLLLEGFQEVEAKWERSVKRKKNRQQQTSKSEETNGIESSNSNHNKENREQGGEGSGGGKEVRFQEGQKKSRGPPRMNRGGGNWRNKENEKNEKNAEESTSSGGRRDREGNRSRGRKSGRGSRSRGTGGGDGNSRSNGGRSRTFQNKSLGNSNSVNGSNEGNSSSNSNNGGGFPPSIEMWNNNTPAEQSTTMNVGNWSDFTASEDWGEEDWTGNLETTVYTPSSSSSSVSRTEANQSGSTKSSLQDPSTLSKPSTMATFVASSNTSSSSTPYGGVSGGGNMYNRSSLHPANSYPSPYSSANSADLQDKAMPEQRQQQNTKLAQRARLPPPSKIPESAVEMPGDSIGALEIQFGGLHFTDSLDFTAITSSEITNSSSFQSNAVNSMPLSNPSPSSLHSYSTVSSSYQLGSSTASSISSSSSLFTSSSSPHPSSILNKEALLLSSSPQAKSANFSSVPRPLSTSSASTLEGSNKSASDLPSFYSSQKLASSVLQSPSQGLGFGGNSSGAPLYSSTSSASSSSNIAAASSSASFQPSSTGLSSYNASVASTEYNSSALGSSVYSTNNPAGVTGASGAVQSSQQQSLNRLPDQQSSLGTSPQGSYGDSKSSQPPPPSQLQSIPSAPSNSALSSNSSAQGLPTVPTSVLKSGASSVLPPPPPSAGNAGSSTKNFLPPGVPAATPALMTPQYIMGQAPPPSLSFYGYYDVPLTNVAAGRDLSSLHYTSTGAASGNSADSSSKYSSRGGSAGGNGSGDNDQQQQSNSAVSSSSQQQTSTFLNPPTGIPPGYGYYIHGGMVTPHYPTPFFSVHQPSSAHGGATTTQFQKPTAYGSHSFNSVSYESLNAQSQDFLKGSYASTSQGKSVSGTDLTSSMYNKGNAAMLTKTFDKSAFQGSPHQYGMATAAPTANTQSPFSFIPVLPQHHSLMHLTRQDSPATAASSVAAANQSKAKPAGYPAAAAAATYWNN